MNGEEQTVASLSEPAAKLYLFCTVGETGRGASKAMLAELLGMSISSVGRAKAELVKAGMLEQGRAGKRAENLLPLVDATEDAEHVRNVNSEATVTPAPSKPQDTAHRFNTAFRDKFPSENTPAESLSGRWIKDVGGVDNLITLLEKINPSVIRTTPVSYINGVVKGEKAKREEMGAPDEDTREAERSRGMGLMAMMLAQKKGENIDQAQRPQRSRKPISAEDIRTVR